MGKGRTLGDVVCYFAIESGDPLPQNHSLTHTPKKTTTAIRPPDPLRLGEPLGSGKPQASKMRSSLDSASELNKGTSMISFVKGKAEISLNSTDCHR